MLSYCDALRIIFQRMESGRSDQPQRRLLQGS